MIYEYYLFLYNLGTCIMSKLIVFYFYHALWHSFIIKLVASYRRWHDFVLTLRAYWVAFQSYLWQSVK